MDKLIRKLEMQGSVSAHELPHDLMKFYGECSAKEISLDMWNKIAVNEFGCVFFHILMDKMIFCAKDISL